ncbi:MAG: TatD family deoxyribonuclease [Dehalococcoidia bacterium]|nr:MAG: TatD family deoxyribonuclease [Dehalococcoidia bacterium]
MIDFHCHLDLYPDPWSIAERSEQLGVRLLSVTTVPSAWSGTAALERDRIHTALGFHPQLALERAKEITLFEELLPRARFVGEVGLDGAPEFRASWNAQVEIFEQILRLCAEGGGRVLSLHSRRATQPVLERIGALPEAGVPILHWFSGTTGELRRAIDLGCWFSVGPSMLAGKRGRELAARMPRDRVLTESDGPFGQVEFRSALPWEVDRAVRVLAEIWGFDERLVVQQLEDNLDRLMERAARYP